MPVFDLLNVANIHNATINSPSLLTDENFLQIRTLADTHEYNLAYNASSPIRAIAGSTLAAQILQALNSTITSTTHAPKLNIQFGAYGAFQSFFGLANLTSASPDFFGIPDYASTMTLELFANNSTDNSNTTGYFPTADDLRVRFLFHNGTTNETSTPTAFPLFGGSAMDVSWTDFAAGMNKFAVGDQASWCSACGNTTGVCATDASSGGSDSGNSGNGAADSGSGSSGMSLAVAGVIGATVTLAVILGIEGLVMLLSGLRVVSKRHLAGQGQVAGGTGTKA